jgi:putative nucleotidyltransferase with HDIG domain
MSVHAFQEAERTRVSNARRRQPMSRAMLRGELLVSGGFLAAALALALLGGVNGFSLPTATLFVLAIAAAGNVRFDVGAGFTVPTQAIFVPMLFSLPVSVVPLLVALALALGMLPRIIRRHDSPSWLLTAASNSWFAVGPSTVLLIASDHSPSHRVGVLILALAAQFICDFAACATRERLFARSTVRELMADVKPIYAIDFALSPLGVAVAITASAVHSYSMVLLVVPLFGVLQLFSRERRERLDQLVELHDAYQGTALLLGDVVEADDAYTGEHCKSVVRLALDVAENLELDADRKRNVEFGALLHDVGKIAIPKEIINKPGKLDDQEWAIVKTHTIEGQRMLEKIGGFMREIGQIVRSSHERWDGAGYPDGLSGETIPLEARIVAACDAFNAMTTTRSYRTAMSHADAIAELERCSGSQFDPCMVASLARVLALPLATQPGEHVGELTPAVQSDVRGAVASVAASAG